MKSPNGRQSFLGEFGDAERLARFEREAKVVASLNHPNIATTYGVAERALIMEQELFFSFGFVV